MYYMEMVVGQFTSRASVKVWEIAPALKGTFEIYLDVGFSTFCALAATILLSHETFSQ